MSNVINYTTYSSVENGRFKLKEEKQFVIKLYYPFIINCCRSRFTYMVKSNRSLKKHTKDDLHETVYWGLCCAHIALPGISSPEEYDYQPNRIMQPISS